MKSVCVRLIEAAKIVGLQINKEKTEYLKVRRQRDGRQTEEFLNVTSNNFKSIRIQPKQYRVWYTKKNSNE